MELCKIITLKKLILIRHSKSSWKYKVSDLERPLSKRGMNDANLMSKLLNDLCINIDCVFSSISTRTKETAKIFLNNLNHKNKSIIESSDLYDFSGQKVDLFIKKIDNKLDTIMVFSHNNSCSNLISKYAKINKHVPTCGILIFDFDVSLWSDIELGSCNYYFPKDFR